MPRPPASELIRNPDALLHSGDLRDLGLERRAIESVFRHCPVVVMPEYERRMVRAADYLAFVARRTGGKN